LKSRDRVAERKFKIISLCLSAPKTLKIFKIGAGRQREPSKSGIGEGGAGADGKAGRRERTEEGERDQQFCLQEHHAHARADGTVLLRRPSHSSHPVGREGRESEHARMASGARRKGREETRGRGKAGSKRGINKALVS
jgi:hypothetical protein